MEFEGQQQLFAMAVEAAVIQVRWEPVIGWSVYLNWRRQGDDWETEPTELYGGLATAELIDVICAELERLLGL